MVLVRVLKVIAVLQFVEEPDGRFSSGESVFIIAQKVAVALHRHLNSENVDGGIPLQVLERC